MGSFLLTSLPLSFSSLSPSLSSLSLPLVSLAVFKMPSQNKGDAPKQHCRYYKQRFPEVDDVVMVNVRSIADVGANVVLLEYDNTEGLILLSELSRGRIRSINKLIRVGRDEAVVVLRVDQEKGYIDLSKRRVSPEEIRKCEEKYNKAKIVNTILRTVADATDFNLEELYERTAWKLEEESGPGSSYERFKLAVTEKSDLLDTFDLPDNVRAKLVEKIKHRLTPQAEKVEAVVEITCYEYEGINAIKEALRAGAAVGDEALPVKITLIAPPEYAISTVSLDKTKGVEKVNQAIEAVEAKLKEHKGNLNIKMAARSITESDELEMARRLEQLAEENTEVDGDDDLSDDEEGA